MSTSGWNTTASLSNALDSIIGSARIVRLHQGVMNKVCDQEKLDEGTGLSWQEWAGNNVVAQAITETTVLDNPQQITGSLTTITPTLAGLEVFITDRVGARINKKVFAQLGEAHQGAIENKKDKDGLLILASGATTCEPGASGTMVSSYIAGAASRITSNSTEPGQPPIVCVLHGYHIKDLFDELVAGVGTYVVDAGPTADVFQHGFTLPIAGCQVYEDGNITIDSSSDAVGGVFVKKAIVRVQGRAPRVKEVRDESRGGGGYHIYHYDEYAYGERPGGNTAGTWLYRQKANATAPTS